MEKEEIQKFEGKPVYLGYDWQCSNNGRCYGFVHNSECYSLSSNGEKIFISVIPAKYLTSLENPKREMSDLELFVISAVREKGMDALKSVNGMPIIVEQPCKQ